MTQEKQPGRRETQIIIMVLKNSKVAVEAKKMYMNRMNHFLCMSRLDSSSSPPSTFLLRQRHAEYKFEALDYFRIWSESGRESTRSWKLERDLEAAFDSFRDINRKLNHERNDSPDDDSFTLIQMPPSSSTTQRHSRSHS